MFLFFLCCNLSAQNPYYWSSGKKYKLQIDSTRAIVQSNSGSRIDTGIVKGRKTLIGKYLLLIEAQSGIYDINQLSRTLPEFKNIHYSFKYGNVPIIPTGEIILKPRNGISISQILAVFGNHVDLIKETKYNTYTLRIKEFLNLLRIANSIYESGLVDWSHPDFIVEIERFQNDPLYQDQYYLNNTGQFGGTAGIDINAPEAWNLSTGLAKIRVAVIDDGVENHEDLYGRVLQGFTPRDPNGLGQPINSAIFEPAHGQACAGIIAASRNNSIGIAGIAPCADIIPVNIFSDPYQDIYGDVRFRETPQNIAAGINWAWDDGQADVLNNSWGFGITNQDAPGFDAIIQAINNARTFGRNNLGSIVIFASGNFHSNFNGVTFPANVDGVITVGAISRNGNIWNYSSRGVEMDLVAPSGDVNLNGDLSTTDRMGAKGYEVGNYTERFGGTSAAAPQVSGVAALMLSVNPNLTEAQVVSILRSSATDMGVPGFDNTFGFGRLNAQGAIQAALPTLSGSSTICSEETYTLSGVPSGHTITWTKSSNLTYISGQNTANYTVKAVPYTAGSMWVEAAVSGPCGVMTFRKNLSIVVPEIDVTFYGETNVCPNEFYWYDVVTPGSYPIVNYIWSLPTGWTLVDEQIINSNFRSIEVRTGNQSYGNDAIWVDIQTDCASRSYSYPVQMMSCASSYDFTVHPNPASDYFEVSRSLSEDNINSPAKERGVFLESQGEKGSAAVAVKLYNSKQEAVISTPFAGPALRVDTKGLPDGHYILHIISKEGIHRKHLYIEKGHVNFSQ